MEKSKSREILCGARSPIKQVTHLARWSGWVEVPSCTEGNTELRIRVATGLPLPWLGAPQLPSQSWWKGKRFGQPGLYGDLVPRHVMVGSPPTAGLANTGIEADMVGERKK